MKFSAAIVATTMLAVFSSASPVDGGRLESRGPSARVTLCDKPNLESCETTYTTTHNCFQVSHFHAQSLSTHGRICDFYPEVGCVGKKQKFWGTKQSLPQSLKMKSASCW